MTAYVSRPLTPTARSDALLIACMWEAWFPTTATTTARMGEPVAYVARITAR